MYRQYWECEDCGKTGKITLAGDENVLDIAVKIGFDHNKLSPECENPPDQLELGDLVEDNGTIVDAGISHN